MPGPTSCGTVPAFVYGSPWTVLRAAGPAITNQLLQRLQQAWADGQAHASRNLHGQAQAVEEGVGASIGIAKGVKLQAVEPPAFHPLRDLSLCAPACCALPAGSQLPNPWDAAAAGAAACYSIPQLATAHSWPHNYSCTCALTLYACCMAALGSPRFIRSATIILRCSSSYRMMPRLQG